jgi:hypothetical protein
VAPSIKTARGTYRLNSAAPPERAGDSLVLTLALERTDGIEKIALRCRMPGPAEDLGGESMAVEKLLQRVAPLIERDFEHLREEALKSIRGERRLFQVVFEDLK